MRRKTEQLKVCVTTGITGFSFIWNYGPESYQIILWICLNGVFRKLCHRWRVGPALCVPVCLISGNWAHEHVGIRSLCCSDSEVHLTEDEAAVQQDPPDQEHFQLWQGHSTRGCWRLKKGSFVTAGDKRRSVRWRFCTHWSNHIEIGSSKNYIQTQISFYSVYPNRSFNNIISMLTLYLVFYG